MTLWQEMLFYCLDILLLSKDVKGLDFIKILLIFFQNMLLVVFDEFD